MPRMRPERVDGGKLCFFIGRIELSIEWWQGAFAMLLERGDKGLAHLRRGVAQSDGDDRVDIVRGGIGDEDG